MTKKLRVSHSQINTFKSCPKKWKLDKLDKIRPDKYKSSFLFGSAIDSVVEFYLENTKTNLIKVSETARPDSMSKFDCEMFKFQLNGVDYNTIDNIELLQFAAADLQPELISEEEVAHIADHLEIEVPDIPKFITDYKDSKGNVNLIEQKLYNHLALESLLVKGEMILNDLFDWIDENVAECVSTQQKLQIENEVGDILVGYLDFVVKLKDGRTVLIDLKTSSDPKRHYPDDAASTSQQLTIYSQEAEVPEVAYLVADKKIRKRIPRVRIRYVEGVITDEQLDKTFEEIDDVLHAMKAGKYPKNEDKCFEYGMCDYYGLCHRGSMKGLVKLDEK